jgi:hypothetical protein
MSRASSAKRSTPLMSVGSRLYEGWPTRVWLRMSFLMGVGRRRAACAFDACAMPQGSGWTHSVEKWLDAPTSFPTRAIRMMSRLLQIEGDGPRPARTRSAFRIRGPEPLRLPPLIREITPPYDRHSPDRASFSLGGHEMRSSSDSDSSRPELEVWARGSWPAGGKLQETASGSRRRPCTPRGSCYASRGWSRD